MFLDMFRYDLSLTKYYFLVFFSIPAGLWIISCSCLVTSNKVTIHNHSRDTPHHHYQNYHHKLLNCLVCICPLNSNFFTTFWTHVEADLEEWTNFWILFFFYVTIR